MNSCWMIPKLKAIPVAVVYVHVMNSAPYLDLSRRFISTYQQFPPAYPHQTVIVCNGGSKNPQTEALFAPLPNCLFLNHDNSGRDIGAHQKAAREVPCEVMVFFGGSTYFRRPGWLNRMVEAYEKYGPTIYGATGNRGAAQIGVYPHIRTTAFWLPPSLMNEYPHRVTRDEQRYPFEHGRHCLTDWVARKGMTPLVVTFAGEYAWENWDNAPGGYHNGMQENVLVGDRLTAPPYWVCP